MYCYTKDALVNLNGSILFMGDSITDDGRYISFLETWLRLYAPKSGIAIHNLGVSSETLSGLSEPAHPFPRPCALGRLERAISFPEIKPDWIVLCYGINDGIYYPFSEERLFAYKDGYHKAISIIRKALPDAKIVAMTPPPFDAFSFTASGSELFGAGESEYSYMHSYEGYDDVMKRYGEWILSDLKDKVDLTIDIYSALSADIKQNRERDSGYISGDGIHPNRHGHFVMANAILEAMFGVSAYSGEASLSRDEFELFELVHKRSALIHRHLKEDVGHDNPYKGECFDVATFVHTVSEFDEEIESVMKHSEAMTDLVTEWNGFKKHIFYFEGFEVTVAMPDKAADGNPWVWRTEFFGAFPSADIAMLQKGWYVVHLGISNLFGAQPAVEIMERFRKFIIKRLSLNEKAVLFGFSRGGLYALNYAAQYPDMTAALYLDAPVVDISSWPGGMGCGTGSQWDWERAQKAFALINRPHEEYKKFALEVVSRVCAAKLPVIIVAGDSDKSVPFEENGKILKDTYEKAGLPIVCIIKEGVGHHPHSLEDPTPIVKFLSESSVF